MRAILLLAALGALALFGARPALAQPLASDSGRVSTEPLKLSGPRFGVTYVSGDLADRLDDEFGAAPILTQFGWQFETRLFTTDTGLSGVTEIVPLIGGLEQSLFLPSFSFLIGLRTANGIEIGLGPNASLAGTAYVIAGGVTQRYGSLNVPVNLSAVLSGEGVRLSLLLGFNLAQ
jgi:hypothetical protein